MKSQRIWGLILIGIIAVGTTAYTTRSKPRTDHAVERAATIARPFAKFAPAVKTHADHEHFFVESDGMPAHKMMVGIKAWQQQVPLPQKYTGNNAWQFPLFPTPAKEPLSAKEHFFRGAIAIAANGVPIFNPIKNDGRTDTFLAGELDEFGGHSGQGDDYHYHILPMHLEKAIGKGLPVAYALDGYPIFGLTEPDGSAVKGLDRFNGHTTAALGYHYHGSLTYPYLNGGFHGEVVEQEGQVHPQPRASSPRPPTRPLRGAKIVGFETVKPGSYSVTYTLAGETRKVNYTVDKDGGVTFEFVDGQGRSTKETYSGGDRRGGRGGRGGGSRPDGLGPPPGPRKPWLVDHAKELDADRNGEVSKSELSDQCREAFKGYAGEATAIKLAALQDRPTVRNAIGGFVKVHAKELDQNGDGSITEKELIDSMMRMFDKQDRDGDGKLSGRELEG
ncbi:MAG TPA: YHYH protein [Fimbriimonadaceae bacterium]|nr:YHYH protein [Fimbriimonadaceae bacterium]